MKDFAPGAQGQKGVEQTLGDENLHQVHEHVLVGPIVLSPLPRCGSLPHSHLGLPTPPSRPPFTSSCADPTPGPPDSQSNVLKLLTMLAS